MRILEVVKAEVMDNLKTQNTTVLEVGETFEGAEVRRMVYITGEGIYMHIDPHGCAFVQCSQVGQMWLSGDVSAPNVPTLAALYG